MGDLKWVILEGSSMENGMIQAAWDMDVKRETNVHSQKGSWNTDFFLDSVSPKGKKKSIH